jgi:uncharacterized protein YndB with AHSA1/START domain
MAALHLVRETTAPPRAVWGVLADFAGYGRWMPLTRMRVDQGEPRVGWGFAGVSGIGPLGFSDSMVVTRWEPPTDEGDDEKDRADTASFRVVKTGRLLGGWADVTLTATATGTRVDWREDFSVRPIAFLDDTAPVRAAGRALYARALDAMLAAAEANVVHSASPETTTEADAER